MKTITAKKPIEEIIQSLEHCQKVYLIGCGTCATMCQTGGKAEVLEMKDKLEAAGKQVTGWMVIPTACDELTREALRMQSQEVATAEGVLVLTCAFGVQTVGLYLDPPKSVYPALNTLFVGVEDTPGHFIEVCAQCGSCILATTAGICPLVRCAKSLMNGPCGGSSGGKCEVSQDIPCAWQLIVDRMTEVGRLEDLDRIVPPQKWSASRSGGPRQTTVGATLVCGSGTCS